VVYETIVDIIECTIMMIHELVWLSELAYTYFPSKASKHNK